MRYTLAYSAFCANIREVSGLRRLAAKMIQEDMQRNADIANYLCRGGVVLLSGHIEGYVKELGEIFLERCDRSGAMFGHSRSHIAYYLSKDIIDEIGETNDRDGVSKKIKMLFSRDHQHWMEDGRLTVPLSGKRFNGSFSNPTFKKIKAYFGRFGYIEYQHNLQQYFRDEFLSYINTIDYIVDARNSIAHGDSAIILTPLQLSMMEKQARQFLKITDNLFANWCKQNAFSIR